MTHKFTLNEYDHLPTLKKDFVFVKYAATPKKYLKT